MNGHQFTYDVHSDEAAAEFFAACLRYGCGEERVKAMQATRAAYLRTVEYIVQVQNRSGRWVKVRGVEGGPWSRRDRAERIAESRENAERRSSSTEGLPHRVIVVERKS